MEGVYGLEMGKPLEHLREYVEIVRAALWDGQVDHQGKYFTVHASVPYTAKVPILTSVLRENAFKQAGEIADGALSWLCPVPYLLKTGLPALRTAAQAAGRQAPPLVAHVLVAVSEDRPAVIKATRTQIANYGHLPFYAAMFADAGYPVGEGGVMSDELIDSLVISGSTTAISERLKELLASGLDELLVLPVAVQQKDSELHQLMQLIGRL
jgi:alkanesulfonate monooxygenase SsuD/methylene tetrahydromethanopterin reductase-like flavin-dependent oxidoreductase (luciferase family)